MKPALQVVEGVPNTCVLEAPPGEEESVNPLAILAADGFMISRWELTDEDRQRIAAGGSVYLSVMGRGHPPVLLTTDVPVEVKA